MTHFDLGTTFDGAVCPINTLLHLSSVELGRHLHRMARHLEPRARYLVQVGLVGAEQEPVRRLALGGEPRRHRSLRVDWVDEELDVVQGISRQRSADRGALRASRGRGGLAGEVDRRSARR